MSAKDRPRITGAEQVLGYMGGDRRVNLEALDRGCADFLYIEPSAHCGYYFVTRLSLFRGDVSGTKVPIASSAVIEAIDILGFDILSARLESIQSVEPIPGRDNPRLAPPRAERIRLNTGSVYFVQQVGGVGPIKIGFSYMVKSRVDDLQIGSPVQLCIVAVKSPASLSDESRLHKKFSHLRCHGEWFRPADDLLEYIASIQGGSDR